MAAYDQSKHYVIMEDSFLIEKEKGLQLDLRRHSWPNSDGPRLKMIFAALAFMNRIQAVFSKGQKAVTQLQ